MTFEEFTQANLARVERWHGPAGVQSWSGERWLLAAAGELGEAANVLKKIWRIEEGLLNKSDTTLENLDLAYVKLAYEIADTITYLDLFYSWAQTRQPGLLPLMEVIRQKFNEVSARYGFPERL